MATLKTIKSIYKLEDLDDKEMLRILRYIPCVALQAQGWADTYYEGHVKRDRVQAYLLQHHEYDAIEISIIVTEAQKWQQKATTEKM